MTRKLFISARSPFARKVRILVLEKALPCEIAVIDLAARTPEFVATSPLGKVPVLRDEDGTVVFDSSVIAEYLEDRYPEPRLLGSGVHERLLHRAFNDLGDVSAEASITLFMDKDSGHAAGLAKAKRQLDLSLRELCMRIERGDVPKEFGLGHAAVISAVHYIELRLGEATMQPYPAIKQWIARFLDRKSVVGAPAPQL